MPSTSVERRQLVGILTTLHCIQRMAFVCRKTINIKTTYDKYARVYSSQAKAIEICFVRWKGSSLHLVRGVNLLIPMHLHFAPTRIGHELEE